MKHIKLMNADRGAPLNPGTRNTLFSPLLSGILGITLLIPASYFMLALVIRVCFGAKGLYYSMAPSFLQSPFDLFALHKAQFILCSLLLAMVFNGLAVLRFRLQRGVRGLEVQVYYKRYWLNMAIALQSGLLLFVLIAYTVIQHVRY